MCRRCRRGPAAATTPRGATRGATSVIGNAGRPGQNAIAPYTTELISRGPGTKIHSNNLQPPLRQRHGPRRVALRRKPRGTGQLWPRQRQRGACKECGGLVYLSPWFENNRDALPNTPLHLGSVPGRDLIGPQCTVSVMTMAARACLRRLTVSHDLGLIPLLVPVSSCLS